jgi:hypothetical protein
MQALMLNGTVKKLVLKILFYVVKLLWELLKKGKRLG